MYEISQGNYDVLSYCTQFPEFVAETTWVEQTQVTLFHRGLREEIKDKLVHSARIDSLSTLMDQVFQIEHCLNEKRREKQKGYSPVSLREGQTPTHSPGAHFEVTLALPPKEPMQISLAR